MRREGKCCAKRVSEMSTTSAECRHGEHANVTARWPTIFQMIPSMMRFMEWESTMTKTRVTPERKPLTVPLFFLPAVDEKGTTNQILVSIMTE